MKKVAILLLICVVMLVSTCGCSLVQEKTTPPQPLDDLGKAEYSEEEILELANADLTLDEAADKLNTVNDAMNYLRACGYKEDFSWNKDADDENSFNWTWNMSAKFTYEHMAGTCGGTSNLFNYLLKNDYDEEGYVRQDGHIFNYFKNEGVYYFCDFAGPWFVDNPDEVLQYSTENPKEYVDVYMEKEPGTNSEDSEFYLTYMYMHASNGKDSLPVAFSNNSSIGDVTGIPDNAENLIILFERDGYPLEVIPAPPEDLEPAETHIPNDAGEYVD